MDCLDCATSTYKAVDSTSTNSSQNTTLQSSESEPLFTKVEHLLSRDNVLRDRFLLMHLAATNSIAISTLLLHPVVQSWDTNAEAIVEAISKSKILNHHADPNNEEGWGSVEPSYLSERSTLRLRSIPAHVDEAKLHTLVTSSPCLKSPESVVSIKLELNDTWLVELSSSKEAQDLVDWLRTQVIDGQPIQVGIKPAHKLQNVIGSVNSFEPAILPSSQYYYPSGPSWAYSSPSSMGVSHNMVQLHQGPRSTQSTNPSDWYPYCMPYYVHNDNSIGGTIMNGGMPMDYHNIQGMKAGLHSQEWRAASTLRNSDKFSHTDSMRNKSNRNRPRGAYRRNNRNSFRPAAAKNLGTPMAEETTPTIMSQSFQNMTETEAGTTRSANFATSLFRRNIKSGSTEFKKENGTKSSHGKSEAKLNETNQSSKNSPSLRPRFSLETCEFPPLQVAIEVPKTKKETNVSSHVETTERIDKHQNATSASAKPKHTKRQAWIAAPPELSKNLHFQDLGLRSRRINQNPQVIVAE